MANLEMGQNQPRVHVFSHEKLGKHGNNSGQQAGNRSSTLRLSPKASSLGGSKEMDAAALAADAAADTSRCVLSFKLP